MPRLTQCWPIKYWQQKFPPFSCPPLAHHYSSTLCLANWRFPVVGQLLMAFCRPASHIPFGKVYFCHQWAISYTAGKTPFGHVLAIKEVFAGYALNLKFTVKFKKKKNVFYLHLFLLVFWNVENWLKNPKLQKVIIFVIYYYSFIKV